MPRVSVKNPIIDRKKEINKAVSRTVDKIFSAKDAWNGKPAPEIGVTEKTPVSKPIPDAALNAFEEAIETLNRVNDSLKDISKQQNNINESKQRRLNLSSLASNVTTRFISHIQAPFQVRDENKWIRLKFLRSAASIYKRFEKINSLILSSDPEKIADAVYAAKDLFYIFENEIYKPYLISIKDKQKQYKELTEEPYESIEIKYGVEAQKAVLDALRKAVPEKDFKPWLEEWQSLRRKLQHIQSLIKINYSEAENQYHKILPEIRFFKEKVESILNIKYSSLNIKEADTFLNKLKRTKTEYLTLPSDNKKALKLRVDDKILRTNSFINEFMDALEKPSVDPVSLMKFVYNICDSMSQFFDVLSDLAEIYNSEIKTKNRQEKKIQISAIPNIDVRSLIQIGNQLTRMKAELIPKPETVE